MVMPSQRCNIHFFSATVFIGLLSATAAFAPPAPPPSPTDQAFGVVFAANNGKIELALAEDGKSYEGRIALKVINNIPLNIIAEVSSAEGSDLPGAWSVKLNEPGEQQDFRLGTTNNKIPALHTPGAEGNLELCIKVQPADTQWHGAYRAFTSVPVAKIAMKVMPEL